MPTDSFNSRPETIAEAAAWFVEFRTGEATASTRIRFDDWLRRSPENIQAYLEVAAGWSELPTSDLEGRIDVESLVARGRASDDENVICLRRRPSSRSPGGGRPWTPALAAGLAIGVILLGIAGWLSASHGIEYTTGVGEQRTITLADGSTIILNALTRVTVRLSDRRREVDLLGGQAFFHDTDDPRRPFIVRSGEATVRAIGTQFDVYDKSSGAVVTVVEGRVAVRNAPPGDAAPSRSDPSARGDAPPPQDHASSVLVSAGQQVILLAHHVRPPRQVDVSAATAWVHRRLVFDDTPLEQVAEQFNLYSSRRLVIADPALRPLGISGVYSSADPNSLIGFLRAQPNLRVTETANEIRVSLRKQQ